MDGLIGVRDSEHAASDHSYSAHVPAPTNRRPVPWVGVVVFVLGSLLLARTYRYYGTLIRGWDAQFYYAQSRSLLFERSPDLTRSRKGKKVKAAAN